MKIIRLLCILSIILTSACSSTSKGTGKYPPKFYDYPIAEQNLIRQGKIAVGFDEARVRMAWGNPSHIRADSNTIRYYWEYYRLETRQSFTRQIGNTVNNVARGGNPAVISREDPFYNKVTKRVVFEASTRTVFSFQTFH